MAPLHWFHRTFLFFAERRGRRPYDRLMLQFRAARDVEDAVPYDGSGIHFRYLRNAGGGAGVRRTPLP